MTERIDKIYREKLEQYASEVSPHAWNNIISGVAQQRRRRNLLILFVALIIAAIAVLGVYYFTNQDQEDNQNVEEIPAALALQENANNQDNSKMVPPDENEKPEISTKDLTPIYKQSYFFAGRDRIGTSWDSSNTVRFASQMTSNKRELNYLNNPQVVKLAPKYPVRRQNLHPFRCNIFPSPINESPYLLHEELDVNRFKSKTLGDCFEGPPSRWMISLIGSLDYPFRSIQDLSNSEFMEYVNLRNHTESGFASFSTGIQTGYFHPSGALIRAGLQYTQINEKFLFVKEDVIKIQTHITIDTMINSDGSVTIHRDTSISEIKGREELKTTNSIRMFDVPLIAGFGFDWNKISVEVNGGVIFNLTSKSGGRIFNTDLVPSYFGTKGNGYQPYRKYFGVSLYGSITFLSNFYGRTQLFLEPNARYYLKSFSSPNYPLRQKYFVVGLSTGVRYYF